MKRSQYIIELFTGRASHHRFFWRIRAANNHILATSEGYTRKHARTRR